MKLLIIISLIKILLYKHKELDKYLLLFALVLFLYIIYISIENSGNILKRPKLLFFINEIFFNFIVLIFVYLLIINIQVKLNVSRKMVIIFLIKKNHINIYNSSFLNLIIIL